MTDIEKPQSPNIEVEDVAMEAIRRIDKHTETYSGSYDDFYIVVKVIKAAQQPRQEWMDISTAPRDGTTILCWHEDYECGSGVTFFSETWGRFNVGSGREQPTHWQPLPAPPKDAK